MSALLLLAAAASVPSEYKFPPDAQWTAHCRVDDRAVVIDFCSASGEWSNDDMSIRASVGDRGVDVPLKPALFDPFGTLMNVRNACDRGVALDAGGGRLLLLVARNGRPGFDELAAALIATDPPAVLDVVENLGTLKHGASEIIVLRNAGVHAWDARVVRETLEDTGADGAESCIEDWKRLDVSKDAIRSRWLRP